MTRAAGEQSIIGRIHQMSRMLVMILVFPLVISLVLMLVYAARYHRSILRMETIASLKPVVAEEIPGAVWDVVSGRDNLEESRTWALLDQVTETMDRITAETGEDDRLTMIVAGRTMDTLKTYVNQIWDNIRADVPVVQNEAILSEVRDVASLVESMLNDYITGEIQSAARMSGRLQGAVILTAILEGILVVIALLISRRTRLRTERFVREPIKQLESVTRQLAEGDLDARLPDTEVTELRNLTGQVNIMADNLEEMMDRSVRDERNLKKAELRTLQAQINPHFLYNTLDAIMWKAEAGEESEVIHLTAALSDFFRISLSSGADWIPISQERKHIAGYLSIQQTRYRDILRYEIDIPVEIGQYYILKLLLQPLVENALYHGIKYRRGGGTIRVTGRLEEDSHLFFTVQDTGMGMTPERLETVRARMAEEQPVFSAGSSGFGLVNVNLRIRLYYNQPEGLLIDSGPEGTTVSFRVPALLESEVGNKR